MPTTSLWELPDVSQLRTPALILKEQAEALTQLTKGILQGRVSSGDLGNGNLYHRLQVVAPLLNGYTHTVVEIEHGISLYPLHFSYLGYPEGFSCETEKVFKENLEAVLKSEPVKNAIGGLLVQSRQTDNLPYNILPPGRTPGATS